MDPHIIYFELQSLSGIVRGTLVHLYCLFRITLHDLCFTAHDCLVLSRRFDESLIFAVFFFINTFVIFDTGLWYECLNMFCICADGFAFSQEEGGSVSQADVIRAYDTSRPRQPRS